MPQMSLTPFTKAKMQLFRLTAALALIALTAACTTTERALAPGRAAPSFATSLTPADVPLLFVVDGVRYPRDQVPSLDPRQVANVRVMKGLTALRQYGPDASYGVVLITTKLAVALR